MPRPNQPRSIAGESELARRVAMEREARGWSYDGLAARMTDAGCAIQGSALYKIEKSNPPRRITVDELIGFATVFGMTVSDLLIPRAVAVDRRLRSLFQKWEDARQEALAASRRSDEAFRKLAKFTQEQHADALEPFFNMVNEWAGGQSEDETEVEAIRAMVLRGAVPVEPFKRMEEEALSALAAARAAD